MNTATTNETFQESGNQDSFRKILKSSASLYETFGSQFFRTATGIQSGPDTFDESKVVMTFLTIKGVTEILCSFRLVLEGKTGKEIPESPRVEFLEKFSVFALSNPEDNTSGPLNRGDIADLPLLRTLLATCLNSQEPSFWEVMESFVLLAHASLAASTTLLQWLLSCLHFTLDSEDLFCWYEGKKWFLWTMAPAQTAENHGDGWDLIWYLRWGIYTSISTWTMHKDKEGDHYRKNK